MNDTAKIMPVEQCGAVSKCMGSPSSYASQLTSGYSSHKPAATRVAAHALAQLEAAHAKDVAMHEANRPAIENNKVVRSRVEALMAEIGMPVSYSERDLKSRSRSPKSIRHDAGYLGELRRHCPTTDGFESATHTYERLLKDYQAYAERAELEAKQAKEKQAREAAAVVERRKADMELAAMLLRYELPIESSWSDVLEALRSRDQRLDLAAAMSQTRGDWSEGPYRVSGAVGRFQIETTEDKDIATCILSCLEDFEDGRVFRDCIWSYSVLFAEAKDPQLSADVQKALQHAGDES
ncbi:hypothetical protein H6CHR_03069 [Variovorax sp. PBL-H6]|uniref:DUF1631 domain-containing protein n=1 Tax=Variovorax sp. PBL-H6 TaxID=434009 RepID=UPI001318BF07|nr:DUF1631 domain-containing protein [Variovorax sp. PBL-H6]VTU28822.1 hypothetical protein H6CHR_03069 [Variovorax sp. PBL-H6]